MLSLKQFRKKHNLSQKALAQILGTTPTAISKNETGKWAINPYGITKIHELYGEEIRPIRLKRPPKVWMKREE